MIGVGSASRTQRPVSNSFMWPYTRIDALAANDMGVTNIIKTSAFLMDRGLLTAFRSARGAVFGEPAPASTSLCAAALAGPRFIFEIEAEAVA